MSIRSVTVKSTMSCSPFTIKLLLNSTSTWLYVIDFSEACTNIHGFRTFFVICIDGGRSRGVGKPHPFAIKIELELVLVGCINHIKYYWHQECLQKVVCAQTWRNLVNFPMQFLYKLQRKSTAFFNSVTPKISIFHISEMRRSWTLIFWGFKVLMSTTTWYNMSAKLLLMFKL